MGMFYYFIKKNIKQKLIGVEACGNKKKNSVFSKGIKSIFHGCKTLVLKRKNKLVNIKSISSGLNYPSVGPELCFLKKHKIVNYKKVKNHQALKAFKLLIKTEGIIPSIESAHAIYYAIKCSKQTKNINIFINLSGNGEKDLNKII